LTLRNLCERRPKAAIHDWRHGSILLKNSFPASKRFFRGIEMQPKIRGKPEICALRDLEAEIIKNGCTPDSKKFQPF